MVELCWKVYFAGDGGETPSTVWRWEPSVTGLPGGLALSAVFPPGTDKRMSLFLVQV